MKETLITSNKSAFIEKGDFQYNGQLGLITYHFKTGQVITYKTKTQQDLLNVYVGTYYSSVGEIYNKLVKLNQLKKKKFKNQKITQKKS